MDGKQLKARTVDLSKLAPSGATPGQVPQFNGTIWIPGTTGGGGAPSGPASGDLNGTYPGPGVATVGGVAAATIAANLPSAGQKAALPGTNGTPGGGNKYVTNSDPRLAGGSASALKTTGADVVVSGAAPPVTGQRLTASSPTTAIWKSPSGLWVNAFVRCTTHLIGTGGVDVIPFNVTVRDTGGISGVGGAHPTRLTATVKGIWRVTYTFNWSGAVAGQQALGFIQPSNDGVNSYCATNRSIGTGSVFRGAMCMFLDVGNYVEVFLDSGGSGTTGTVDGVWATMRLMQVAP